MNLIENILSNKMSTRGEFFINLFEHCNLRCSFCWQDHNDTKGMDTIKEKSELINTEILKMSSKHTIIDLNLMGGELFSDEITDNLINDYLILATRIDSYALSLGVQINFNWVTNLVFTKRERIKSFLTDLRKKGMYTYLTSSYDPKGRFNSKTRQIFIEGLEYFKQEIKTISIVLTSPNISFLTNKKDETFKYIYDHYPCYFDFYSPEKNHKLMAPTDKDLRDFFIFLIDNYPKSYPINDWIRKKENKMSCRRSTIITPEGLSGKCRLQLSKENFEDFNSEIDLTKNDNMEIAFVEKYKCLECEFYQKCSLGCFLQEDYKNYNVLSTCMMKEVFRYIEDNDAL